MIKQKTLKFIFIALFLQANIFVVANGVFGEDEEKITDEMIGIISNLDLLENLEMLGEDLSLLDEYEEIDESDELELTGGNDDK